MRLISIIDLAIALIFKQWVHHLLHNQPPLVSQCHLSNLQPTTDHYKRAFIQSDRPQKEMTCLIRLLLKWTLHFKQLIPNGQ